LLEPYFSTKICNTNAWNGGSSVEISGSLNQNYVKNFLILINELFYLFKRTIIKMFKVNIPVENDHELNVDLNIWGSNPKVLKLLQEN